MKVAGLERPEAARSVTSGTLADAAEKARRNLGAPVSTPWSSPSPRPGFAQRHKLAKNLWLLGLAAHPKSPSKKSMTELCRRRDQMRREWQPALSLKLLPLQHRIPGRPALQQP